MGSICSLSHNGLKRFRPCAEAFHYFWKVVNACILHALSFKGVTYDTQTETWAPQHKLWKLSVVSHHQAKWKLSHTSCWVWQSHDLLGPATVKDNYLTKIYFKRQNQRIAQVSNLCSFHLECELPQCSSAMANLMTACNHSRKFIDPHMYKTD